MKPPYTISPKIIELISSISIKLGEMNALYLDKQEPKLRKQNRIKTIFSSLQIEGNTLSEDQIEAIVNNKKVIGPAKDILEVKNAIQVYDAIQNFKPNSVKSFLSAHKMLMSGLVDQPGKYRNKGVGIVKGSKVAHLAPSYKNVPGLMNDLFAYLKKDEDLVLIKSCVFHYELEFIHPFMDGNGRMGRLWQTLILLHEYPVFEFLPFESIIHSSQKEYYKALSQSDNAGNSTLFIEYMLTVLDKTLKEVLGFKNKTMSSEQRLEYFVQIGMSEFTRLDYMAVFKTISSATASRDLIKGVELNLFSKSGMQNKTIYKLR
ncbi:MAG: Fic family protein [Bacteroidia bacterium]|jgi:Fic family protein|nr:Fic family protein [Bacteroidia bacterium]